MIKKLLSITMLIFLTCFSLSAVACSNTKPSDENDEYAADEAELWEWKYGAPDEVLSGSTSELLEFFLQSNYMWMELAYEGFLSSPPTTPHEPDFTCHEAFAELITRDDLPKVLEEYAGKILRGKFDVNYTISGDETSFDKVLKQPSVKSLLTDLTDMPNLQKMYDSYIPNS